MDIGELWMSYRRVRTISSITANVVTFQISGGTQDTLQITITPEEYLDKLVDHGLIKIYAIASVEETKQTWSEEDDFTMTLPPMSISLPDSCEVNVPCEIQFRYKIC